MSHYRKRENVFYKLYLSYIPNRRDNLKQITIKLIFIISLIVLIVSSCFIVDYFLQARHQDSVVERSRSKWNAVAQNVEPYNNNYEEIDTIDPFEAVKKQLIQENRDFKGWISISGTKVDNPIYQTDNNDYYLAHNQQKKKSVYGALFFDCENEITKEQTDKNLIIYGHQMKNGSMFGTLKKFKSLSFYKQNPIIKFSTLYKNSTYKIYAVFVMNSVKSDDNGYIYNISRNKFINDEDFYSWRDEAYQRSIINTNVDVEPQDNIITLVTCESDFENARLIIMARELREDEDTTVDTSNAHMNDNPRYPQKWYDERGIKK